jgi:hypothetical protein
MIEDLENHAGPYPAGIADGTLWVKGTPTGMSASHADL